jgi:FLVCR family feline leukemia virus subgroup C receptor-related protein
MMGSVGKHVNEFNSDGKEIQISLINSVYEEDEFAKKVAILFFIANGLSAAMSTTLSPLSEILTFYFKASDFTIWYLNSSFTLYFLIMNTLANWVIDRYGVKVSIQLGLSLTVIGSWLRLSVNTNIRGMIFGHTLTAIGGPFIANCISKVSNIWFLPKNRTKMTSLMSSSYMFGLGFGFLLTSTFWKGGQLKYDELSEIIDGLKWLMYYSALFCTLLSIPVFLYFRSSPKKPPSLSATSERVGCLGSITTLIKNKDYNLLLTVFSIALGNFITMVLMIHHVISPFNFSIQQISNVGLIINFASGCSKAIIAYIAPHFKFRKIIFVILIALLLCTILLFYTLESGDITYLYLSSFLFGSFCQMYWGPALEYACEVSFPVSESHATGNLLFGGSVMGLITNFTVLLFYHKDPTIFLIYLMISYALCAYLINLMSDNLRREDFENNIK